MTTPRKPQSAPKAGANMPTRSQLLNREANMCARVIVRMVENETQKDLTFLTCKRIHGAVLIALKFALGFPSDTKEGQKK